MRKYSNSHVHKSSKRNQQLQHEFPAHAELTENIYTECTLQLNPQHKGKLSGYARSRDRRRVGSLADSIPLTSAVGSKVRYQVGPILCWGREGGGIRREKDAKLSPSCGRAEQQILAGLGE